MMNKGKNISNIRTIGLALIFLINTLFIPITRAAWPTEVTLTANQIFTVNGSSTPPNNTFNYRLTPTTATNPIPVGGNASGYNFNITGTNAAQIGPIKFSNGGLYTYELRCIAGSENAYTYDPQVYTIEVHVINSTTVTVIISNSNGNKIESINFEHSYGQIYHNIIYKNYDGTDLNITDPTYPQRYLEGVGIPVLPTNSPSDWMPGYDLYGLYDCALNRNRKVPIGMIGYEGEESLNFNIGTKITSIPTTAKNEVTLYLRPWSRLVDQDLNGRENYLYAPYGVFPNGSWANIRILNPESAEYQSVLPEVEEKGRTKIVEFEVFDENDIKIQPNAFFGFIVLGFRVPEEFNVNDIKIWRVLVNEVDLQLRDRIWVDPTDPTLWYIEGYTDHLSPYAIVTPEKGAGSDWWEWATTGDRTWILITGLSAIIVVSIGILIWINKKKSKQEKL